MAKEKLMEIVDALKSDKFAAERAWDKAARLVCDGVREISAYTSEQIKLDAELDEAGRYLFTQQIPLYMNGARSNVFTRRLLWIALAELGGG
jgi:hypothetical protein